MPDSHEMQKRYFTAQLEKFKEKPELYSDMIKDCEYYLKMLEETGSPAAFKRKVNQTGNMVSAAKANALCRYRNRLHVYMALGQEHKADEERQRIAVVKMAESHGELSSLIEEFEGKTDIGSKENKALNFLSSVMAALFQLCSDGRGSRDESRDLAVFKKYWRMMKEVDPEISWERIMTYKPYRDRLPFTDRQMSFIERKFREVENG